MVNKCRTWPEKYEEENYSKKTIEFSDQFIEELITTDISNEYIWEEYKIDFQCEHNKKETVKETELKYNNNKSYEEQEDYEEWYEITRDKITLFVDKNDYDKLCNKCRKKVKKDMKKKFNILEKEFEKQIQEKINSNPYLKDYNNSVKFFKQFKIPKNKVIRKTLKSGCLMCHNDNIPDKVHYALLKGYCDIKTVQYYLYSLGINYKGWYIQEHIKHLWVDEVNEIEVMKKVEEYEIIEKNIQFIMKEIERLEKLGTSKSQHLIIELRKDLKEWLQLKSGLQLNEVEKENISTLSNILSKFKTAEKVIDVKNDKD